MSTPTQTTMTINQVIESLRLAPPDAHVVYDFCGCVPTHVGSWRGDYSQPAIGWDHVRELNTPPPCARRVINELTEAISGRVYEGWKGGQYTFTGDQQLVVDRPGEYTGTRITGIEYTHESSVVMIRTHCER